MYLIIVGHVSKLSEEYLMFLCSYGYIVLMYVYLLPLVYIMDLSRVRLEVEENLTASKLKRH